LQSAPGHPAHTPDTPKTAAAHAWTPAMALLSSPEPLLPQSPSSRPAKARSCPAGHQIQTLSTWDRSRLPPLPLLPASAPLFSLSCFLLFPERQNPKSLTRVYICVIRTPFL